MCANSWFLKFRWLFALVLPLLAQTPLAAGQRFELTAGKHIAQQKGQSVRLACDGRQLDLSNDATEVDLYFAGRPADPVLSQQIGSLLTKQSAERGIALREGRLTLALFRPTAFPPDPTWAENPFHDDNWVFNLHSMRFLPYLLAAYHFTGDTKYIKSVESFVTDWIRDNTTESPPSPFSWSDHSTAMRLENFLYIFEYVRRRGAKPTFLCNLLQSIHLHCSILADPQFYVRHTNHGLDQSYRLYWAAAAIPEFSESSAWRKTARDRILDELSFALSDEGVQVENSPAYHYRHLSVMAQIGGLLSHYEGRSIFALMGNRLQGALKYAAYVLKPDGRQPILGDSQGTEALGWKRWLNSYAKVPGFSNLLYSVTGGEQGVKPKSVDVVFPNSGYAILRDRWGTRQDFAQSVYLLLKTGFLSTVHRHQDDLSILLYGYGEDWLIDSGLYRYQEDDPLRQYMRSAEAHNLAIVDDVDQIRSGAGLTKSRIDSFQIANTNSSVTASHELFPGYETTRKLEYFKPARIDVADEILPEDGRVHAYRILFHVPADKQLLLSNDCVIVASQRSSKLLFIRPLRGVFNNVHVESGMRKPHCQGWVSYEYGKATPSSCVVFETRGTNLNSLIELEFKDCPKLDEDVNEYHTQTMNNAK